MKQTSFPFLFMRGGSSRGPYILRSDLPADEATLAKVLIAALGSGHSLNIDGIGGGNAVTTKVAMLSPSQHDWAEVDYFFAQVSVFDKQVDFKPTCGNMLAGVGPAAIELGLVPIRGPVTTVKIRAVNTGALVESSVNTPDGYVEYEGDTQISGAPGSGAPIFMSFRDVVGSATGALLPTGELRNVIDGVPVSCVDVAMPMVIAKASDLDLTGYETPAELDGNRKFFEKMEAVRRKAALLMKMGDVSQSVIPKFGILAPARDGGAITARYFMPVNTHPSMAVTGSQCIASCILMEGTVADGLLERPAAGLVNIAIEHPSGTIDVAVDYSTGEGGFELRSAGLIRTARLLARGSLMVPGSVWDGKP